MKTLVSLLLIVPGVMFNGWTLRVLWGWFITPQFGLPTPSVSAAIGIGLVVSYLTHQIDWNTKEDDDETKAIAKSVVAAFGKPAFALLFGWIVVAVSR